MENNEIFARIASDVADADRGMFGVRDITIGMTVELFRKLFPENFLLRGNEAMSTLFGCKVKVFPCSGLWWIAGYEGMAKEAVKALEIIKETAEERRREAEYQAAEAKSKEKAEMYGKEAAEAEIRAAEAKAALADKIAQLTPEQLEAYNKEMEPIVQTVPVPLFGPIINLTPGYNQQGIVQQWRGW